MKQLVRRGLGVVGVILVVVSFIEIRFAAKGLDIDRRNRNDIPITIITPKNSAKAAVPIVLVGHGFAGSSGLMRSFGFPIAYAGYAVVLWDFDGHARNPRPLTIEGERVDLVQNASTALEEAITSGSGDPSKVAILGHSMGSGVAMSFGQQFPDTAATIAVSPVGVEVTPTLPGNLLLMAGENEAGFVRSAQDRLVEAGGEGGNLKDGTARALKIFPWVEHITILFSSRAHHAAIAWLNGTFGVQPASVNYKDWRIYWYLLAVLGTVLVGKEFTPATKSLTRISYPVWRKWLALIGGIVGAILLLYALEGIGVPVSRSFGLLVGGYLMIWFAVAGLIGIFLLGSWRDLRVFSGWQEVYSGLAGAAFLWLGIGVLGDGVFQSWWIISKRLALWPLAILLVLPWFLLLGTVNARTAKWERVGFIVLQITTLVGGLLLAIQLSSGLGFLMIILPVLPVVLLVHALVAARQNSPWAYGLSAALFISWEILAIFPLH